MSQAEDAAVEITTVESAAKEIESLLEAEEETTEETKAEVDTEAEDQETDESTEAEADEDETEEDTESEEPDEESEDTYESIEELAEALDMPVETFAEKIKGKVKIDGVEQEVTLSEMAAGYQMEADYRRKTTELAEQRRELEAVAETARNEEVARLNQLDAMLTAAEQQLVTEYQGVDWNELRETDPAEFSAKRQEFSERQAHLEHIKMQGMNEAQRIQSEAQAKQTEDLNAYKQKEWELLTDKLPDFKEPETASKNAEEINHFLKTRYGYTQDEINDVVDHRTIMMIMDAMGATKTAEKIDIAKKKVKKLPKVLKSGAKQTKKEQTAKTTSEKMKKFNKDPSRNNLVDALLDRM